MNVDLLKQQQNRGYVIAGGAAIIAFIAFFLPYAGVAFISVSGASLGWVWLEEIGAIVVMAVSAILVFRNNAFGMTNTPIDKQIKYGRYALLGGGALALLIHLLFLIGFQGSILGSIGVGLGFGWFLFLLAAIGMVVGAVMAYRQPIAAYPASQQYGQYGQQYPGQSTQYPPYQQPYSTTDQQQYPPYQSAPPQQYPAQQYPPQPQQPYPQQPQPQQYPPTEMPPQQYPPQQR